MKVMRFWMNAAILTVCGVMNIVLTSCGKAEEPVNPANPTEQKEVSKYTIAQIVSEVVGINNSRIAWRYGNYL